MNKLIENAIKALNEEFPLLNNPNIRIALDEYPSDYKYHPEEKNTPPYAHLNVRDLSRKKDGKSYTYDVTIYTNMFEAFGDHMFEGSNECVKKFFDAINVDFNNESLIIFNLIHELGHVLLYESFRSEFGAYSKLNKIEAFNENVFDLIFDGLDDKKFNDAINNYHFSELYSEKFAYANFPAIWSKIHKNDD